MFFLEMTFRWCYSHNSLHHSSYIKYPYKISLHLLYLCTIRLFSNGNLHICNQFPLQFQFIHNQSMTTFSVMLINSLTIWIVIANGFIEVYLCTTYAMVNQWIWTRQYGQKKVDACVHWYISPGLLNPYLLNLAAFYATNEALTLVLDWLNST